MDFDRFISFVSSFLLALLILTTIYYIVSFSYNLLGFWWSMILIGSCARSYYINLTSFNG